MNAVLSVADLLPDVIVTETGAQPVKAKVKHHRTSPIDLFRHSHRIAWPALTSRAPKKFEATTAEAAGQAVSGDGVTTCRATGSRDHSQASLDRPRFLRQSTPRR